MKEFAPEYTRKERVIFIVKHTAWALPMFAFAEFWFFDWLSEYSDKENCKIYFDNITGTHFLMYGLCAGIPFLLAAIILFPQIGRSIKILKLKQYPLPGERVFQKTEYKYGWRAKAQPISLFFAIGFFLALSIWGALQAHTITQGIKSCGNQLKLNENSKNV